MINLRGKHGEAIVYNYEVEQEAISQIINLLNQPMSENANVRIMPDVHAGAGCVIGGGHHCSGAYRFTKCACEQAARAKRVHRPRCGGAGN